MFTVKEVGAITAALQSNKSVTGDQVLEKIERMVSRKTIKAVMPCVRPANPLDMEDGDPADRGKVFETERELVEDIRKIVTNGKAKYVLVCVPGIVLAERVTETLGRCLGEFRLRICRKRVIEMESGLTIRVVSIRGEETCGMHVDWAFFYNEVAGF